MADTKRLVIGMLLAVGLILGWQYFAQWLAVKQGWTTTPATQPVAATVPTATQQAAVEQPPSSQLATTSTSASASVTTTQPAQTARLGHFELQKDRKQTYPLGMELTPDGAAISRVVLNEFSRHAQTKEDQDKPYTFQEPYAGREAESRPLATRSVTVNGQSIELSRVAWGLLDHTIDSATYQAVITTDAGILRINKTYQLQPRTSDSMGYEVIVTHAFYNDSDRPMRVSTAFNGPTVPVKEFASDQRQVIAGYWDQAHVRVTVGYDMVTSFGAKMPSKAYQKNKDDLPALWAGASSVYFDAIVLPQANAGVVPDQLASIEAKALDISNADAEQRDIVLTFQTIDLDVKPRTPADFSVHAFFGPKMRAVLEASYYAKRPRGYDQTLSTLGSSCSFCTFSWLIWGMVRLLLGFHWLFGGFGGHGDWGLAIIGLVAVVRIALHPITKRSTIAMSKMSKMAPEMERLKKKYGDNKEELNKAMWQFQKEQGFTPILGCLPMFLQMPIWIALWTTLQNTFELRQAPFLQFGWFKLTWISDLSQPDRLIAFGQSIPLLFFHIDAINLLPVLLAFVFYLQQKYTPQAPATTPEQQQQQKMMKWMSLIFPIFLYSSPSGLNLYILTSTFVGIIESKRIRDHIKQREEAEKAGVVIVDDVKPTRAARKQSQDKKQDKKDKQRTGLAGWLADLQDRADQIRRNPDKRK